LLALRFTRGKLTFRFSHGRGDAALPLYEYECTKCGTRTEKIEKVAGPHLKKCPKCGGKVERLPSAPSVQFKGSGWYVTDYGGKSSGSESAKAEKAEGGKETKETKEMKETKDKKESPKETPKSSSKEK
jgi:putative FmdB family regulatory protein